MTPEQFKHWLAAVKASGQAKSDADAAKLIGVHANSLLRYKISGADKTIALACRAVFHKLGPYDGE